MEEKCEKCEKIMVPTGNGHILTSNPPISVNEYGCLACGIKIHIRGKMELPGSWQSKWLEINKEV